LCGDFGVFAKEPMSLTSPSLSSLVSALCIAPLGCALSSGCKKPPPAPPPPAIESLIPLDATAVALVEPALLEAAPDELRAALCPRWPRAPLHPCEPHAWPDASVSPQGRVALFLDQAQPALLVSMSDPDATKRWLLAHATPTDDAQIWRLDAQRSHVYACVLSHHLLITPADDANPEAAPRALRRWRALSDEQRWDASPTHRTTLTQLGHHPLVATLQLSALFQDLPAPSEHATLLLERLQHRSGTLALALGAPSRHEIPFFLLHHEDQREPSTLDSLGLAPEPLIPPEGILDHDTPLILHLAFEPTRLWDLWRSTLAPPDRAQLDELLLSLQEDFMIDLERSLIHNIQGHVLLIVPTLATSLDAMTPLERLQALFTLRGTHELIVIPLDDGERLTQAFDVFTQLSRGALRRSSSGGQIYYALFQEGELAWTFMIHDDDLLIADSSTSFDLAKRLLPQRKRRKKRDPEVLTPEAQPTPEHILDALDSTSGLGLILHTEPLRALWPDAPKWLYSVHTITLHTSPGQDTHQELIEGTIHLRGPALKQEPPSFQLEGASPKP
jgi:hypothetical protein